jgi:thiol-disulfide isomerase/thioredoxin
MSKELIGDTWFGTDRKLSVGDFKGRYLLLDFWTLCCVNCHHVLAELRPLEEKFSELLTVVGIHSPKFEHEKDPEAVRAAISRHGIDHLVLNDPNMSTWEAFGVRAWPTLVLIDPAGEIIGTFSGEGHGHAIDALISSTTQTYQDSGLLIPGQFEVSFEDYEPGVFNQPGKLSVIPEGYRSYFQGADLLVSNSGSHNLHAVSSEALSEPVMTIGSSSRGSADGDFAQAEFSEPYGTVFLEPELAETLGYELIVADTANHLIRAVSLRSQRVSTIAGTTLQWMQNDETSGAALEINLSTPWDITVSEGLLLIAMAGEHRIWTLDLQGATVQVLAGTTNEGLQDGPFETAWFAQSSGLLASKTTNGLVWVIDAETSSLRKLQDGVVTTLVGKGLFEFGHLDGNAGEALLQHPLGLTELPNGQVVIADSYNASLRVFDPATNKVATLARDLSEPSDVVMLDGDLYIAEASGNRISKLPIAAAQLVVGESFITARPASILKPGLVDLEVVFVPPPGQKIDLRYGPATYLDVSSTPPELLLSGAGSASELTRIIEINPEVQDGVIHVAAKGASCDSNSEHATCHIHQQDWGIPVKITEAGEGILRLSLSGN